MDEKINELTKELRESGIDFVLVWSPYMKKGEKKQFHTDINTRSDHALLDLLRETLNVWSDYAHK